MIFLLYMTVMLRSSFVYLPLNCKSTNRPLNETCNVVAEFQKTGFAVRKAKKPESPSSSETRDVAILLSCV